MSPVIKILICACAIFPMLDTVAAIECYACDSTNSPDTCGIDFSDKTTIKKVPMIGIDCHHCVKTDVKSEGKSVITRFCLFALPDGSSGDECKSEDFDGLSGEHCICSTDLCNGVGKQSGSLFVILTVPIFKYLW